MANVKIKIRTSSNTWDTVYPETSLEQISDVSPAGRALAELDNPSDASRFAVIKTDGSAELLLGSEVRILLGAAAKIHSHDVDDIDGLDDVLASKADLDPSTGALVLSQVPQYLLNGMRFIRVIDTDSFTLNSAWLADLDNKITQDVTSVGNYYIISYTKETCTITFGTDVLFKTGDESGNASPLELEGGDAFIYRGYDAINEQYMFDVINSQASLATSDVHGVVGLSMNTTNNRTGLSNIYSAERVVTESVLRKAMKNIFYSETDPAAEALEGDLFFHID